MFIHIYIYIYIYIGLTLLCCFLFFVRLASTLARFSLRSDTSDGLFIWVVAGKGVRQGRSVTLLPFPFILFLF